MKFCHPGMPPFNIVGSGQVLVNRPWSVDQSGHLIFGLKSTKFSNLEFKISDILHWTKVAN